MFDISHGRRQSTQCGACRGGGSERPVPTPPAHGIKDTAAGAQTELQQLKCLVQRGQSWKCDLGVKTY